MILVKLEVNLLFLCRKLESDDKKVRNHNMLTGILGSYMEGHIFAQMFAGEVTEEALEPVSTMHVLNRANREGISVYTIDEENMEEVLPKLEYSKDKKQEFRNFIENGKEITVPEREVVLGDWDGMGYIVLDSDDGTGAYMISGRLAGGEFILKFKDNFKAALKESLLTTLLGYISKAGSVGEFVYTLYDMFTFERPPFKKLTFDQYEYLTDLKAAADLISYIGACTALMALLPFVPVGSGSAVVMAGATYIISNLISAYQQTLLEIWAFLLRSFYIVLKDRRFTAIV